MRRTSGKEEQTAMFADKRYSRRITTMQLMPRLFVGKHRELRRPMNVVDEALMKRIEDAREQLIREGKQVKPIRTSNHPERPPVPYRPSIRFPGVHSS
jgi:hypothetical protein